MPEENENKIEEPISESLNKINPGKEKPTVGFFSFLLDLLKTFIIVMLIAFAIRYFVIQPFVVDGESMMPTFVNNEYLIAEKISYDFEQPERGDVVIFRYPKNTSVIYIKRVIGLPGETVTIKNDGVYITAAGSSKEVKLNEHYLDPSVKTDLFNPASPDEQLKVTLGSGDYFVLGDNRDHSSDSREWGILPRANIIGRVWLTVTPISKLRIWGHQSY